MWFSVSLVLRIIVIWLALKIFMAFDERGPSSVARNLRGRRGGSRRGRRKGSTRSSSRGNAELPFWGVFVILGVFASIVLCVLGGFCIVSCKQLWSKRYVKKEANEEVESEYSKRCTPTINMTTRTWTPADKDQTQEARAKLDVWPLYESNAVLLNEVHPLDYVNSDPPYDEYDLVVIGAKAGSLISSYRQDTAAPRAR
jgi:hypothetical protein